MKRIYISTTLPYSNSFPHVGHALEMVQADFLSRFFKQLKKDVFFNTGLDEHGTKIYETALSLGKTPQQHIDSMFIEWEKFYYTFKIEHNSFYRTSDQEHKENFYEIWKYIQDFIYQKEYEGKYCVGCEEFKNDSELIDNKCSIHQNLELQNIKEENYFLKLTQLDKEVLYHIENKKFIYPSEKKNELINNVKNVRDLSISRDKNKCPWGIIVPNDDSQTVYVWAEALTNYVSAIGRDDWNKSTIIQLCGPDNIRFQGHIWQSMLNALDLKFTDKLLVHGTILDSEGKKMSKSIGNVIDPMEQVEKYGIDAVRLYILSLPTFKDSNWSEKDLVELYNSKLCNDYGNLISRTLHLIDICNIEINKDEEYLHILNERIAQIFNDFTETFDIANYLENINILVKEANKLMTDKKPWEKKEGFEQVLSNIYLLLYRITDLYHPILTDKCFEIINALDAKKKVILFKKL